MSQVFNNINKVAGEPQLSAQVTIYLSWDTSLSPVAKVNTTDSMIQGPFGASTDESGHWSAMLVPNIDISPIGSVYKIVESVSSNLTDTVYYISVPDGATPVYWVGDIIVSTPDWV